MTNTTLRVDWVDYAKGICIILVVMMHSTLGVENALGQTGHLHDFIAWAQPFRMPDFFLISGLFLMRRIDAPWRSYLDSKVLHFAYFYLLWTTLQFGVKSPWTITELCLVPAIGIYIFSLVEPFGTLWFIYLLAVFFVFTKLTRRLPPALILAAAALLEVLPIHTGWTVIDEFAARYVYFFAGYWLAPMIFDWANQVWHRNIVAVVAMIYIWAIGHSLAIVGGLAQAPGMGLVLGFAGCTAVISVAILLARSGLAEWLRYLGNHSLIVYLAFFIFMAATRGLGLRLFPNANVDVLAGLTTMAGLAGPIAMYWLLRDTGFNFVFKRPAWISLKRVEYPVEATYSDPHDIFLKQPQAR